MQIEGNTSSSSHWDVEDDAEVDGRLIIPEPPRLQTSECQKVVDYMYNLTRAQIEAEDIRRQVARLTTATEDLLNLVHADGPDASPPAEGMALVPRLVLRSTATAALRSEKRWLRPFQQA